MVYDAGEDRSRMRECLAALGVTEAGLVIASHNHADHIAGLDAVLTAFRSAVLHGERHSGSDGDPSKINV